MAAQSIPDARMMRNREKLHGCRYFKSSADSGSEQFPNAWIDQNRGDAAAWITRRTNLPWGV